MNCKEIKIPGIPTTNFFYKFCNQFIDGKICVYSGRGRREPEAQQRDLWAYDLSKFLPICFLFEIK